MRKFKLFSLFRGNSPAISNTQPNFRDNSEHLRLDFSENRAQQPSGDRNLSDSAVECRNFSETPEEIGSERKYSHINHGFSEKFAQRLQLFDKVSQEIRDNSQEIAQLPREIVQKPAKTSEKREKSEKVAETLAIPGENPQKVAEKRRFLQKFVESQAFSLLKTLLICWFLALNSSIFEEMLVGLYSSLIISCVSSSLLAKIFELTLRETQYTAILKELQVFRIDKERKTYILANMRDGLQKNRDFSTFLSFLAGFLAAELSFPLFLTKLGSCAVFLQVFLISCGFFAVILAFRCRNNKKIARNPQELEKNPAIRHNFRDFSSSYLRFLQDFEKNKTKILEKADFRGEVAINFSSYLTKRTLEAGLQKNIAFYLPIRAVFETFLCFFFALLQIFANFLLIHAFLQENAELVAVLAMVLCVFFAVYREIVKFLVFRGFLYQKLFKVFRVLTCFCGLLPFKLMIFAAETCKTPPVSEISQSFRDFCVISCVKVGFKVAIFAVLFTIWLKIASFLRESEAQKPSLRKNKRKRDKTPESIVFSQFSQGNTENFNEYFKKKCKEFALSFFLFNFCDFLCTILVFLAATTLHFVPKTRFHAINSSIFQGYLQSFAIELAMDAIIVRVLYAVFRKTVKQLQERDWLGEGLRFIKKRGGICAAGLFFVFFTNFFCFDAFFLSPYL